jgi:hypothetical protein
VKALSKNERILFAANLRAALHEDTRSVNEEAEEAHKRVERLRAWVESAADFIDPEGKGS